MELSLTQLTDEEKLATLAQVYLALGLPLKAALHAARADLANLVAVQEEIVSCSEPSIRPSRFAVVGASRKVTQR